MKFIRTKIPDVIICESEVFEDQRGSFTETFRQDQLEKFIGHTINFCQDNESKSVYGVLRGLHYQLPPFAQTKLIRVITGKVLDVTVDIRKGSPTFGKHVSIVLSGDAATQLFIPRGFAHGFIVLSKEATLTYKVDNYYSPENERGIAYNNVDIDWQLDKDNLILSDKDLQLPKLSQSDNLFDHLLNLYE